MKLKRKKGTTLIKSKKVTYDGHTFDSTLEVFMYKALKEAGIVFGYTSKTYMLLEKMTYPKECFEKGTTKGSKFEDKRNTRKMEYTPDFIGENEEWVIETKGRANESFPLRWKIFKNLMKDRDKKAPMLFKPQNQTECMKVIEILKTKGYGR